MTIQEIRATQTLRDLQESLAGWQSSAGPQRQRYRQYVRQDIAAWKRARARAMAAQSEALRIVKQKEAA